MLPWDFLRLIGYEKENGVLQKIQAIQSYVIYKQNRRALRLQNYKGIIRQGPAAEP